MKRIIFYVFMAACVGIIAAFVYVSYIVSNGMNAVESTSQDQQVDTEQTQERGHYSVEVHNHFSGMFDRLEDYDEPMQAVLAEMETYSIDRMIMMPQPYPNLEGFQMDIELLAGLTKQHDELELFAGGESLNKMIQAAKEQPNILDQGYMDEFEQKARELVELGAIGFGEMTALHFSLDETHPFEEVDADHPLFLLLADLAAEYDIPIDMHMEAVAQDMDFPFSERITSTRNPKRLSENIEAFKRLLEHNRDAKIIWSHAGWCNTGHRTPELMTQLLEDHPNLYMSLKVSWDSEESTRPATEDGELRQEWLEMFEAYPDRFTTGADKFYATDEGTLGGSQRGVDAMQRLLGLLPEELAYRFRAYNPSTMFGW